MPANTYIYHSFIEQGETWARGFPCVDSSGNAIDFTGYTVSFFAENNYGDTITGTVDDILAVVGNIIYIQFEPAETTAMQITPYRYQLTASIEDEVDLLVKGNLEVRP